MPPVVTLLVQVYRVVMFDWIAVFWATTGLYSMLVGRFRSRLAELQEQPFHPALSPFRTIAAVGDAMRRAPEFKKVRQTASEKAAADRTNLSRFRPAAWFGMTMKHGRSESQYAIAAVRYCGGARPTSRT